jgi:hypothetical protein
MTDWTHRVRLLAACITLFGGVSLLEAAPVSALDDPCDEADLCEAYSYLANDCTSMNEPGIVYCPTNMHACMRDEMGHIYYLGICTPYDAHEGCPLLAPCG